MRVPRGIKVVSKLDELKNEHICGIEARGIGAGSSSNMQLANGHLHAL